MPLFDFHCEGCKTTYEDEFVNKLTDKDSIYCGLCGGTVQLQLSVPAKPYEFQVGLYHELMGPNNKVPITSKKQLAKEADKRGKYSEYAHG